jgi:hypothetical protein
VRVVGIEIDPGAPAAVLPPLLRADGLEDLQEPIGVGDPGDGDDHYPLPSPVDDFPPVDPDRRTSTMIEVN